VSDQGHWWYLSAGGITVAVRVLENGRVVQGPPIVRKFMGQPVDNLLRWMQKHGDVTSERLDHGDPRIVE